jgi:glucosamine--fructose-6-phosphate aminotransferase (isomerizing)
MCGIYGILLNNNYNANIYALIINGLLQLQNRGYDSAGLSVIDKESIEVHKFASTSSEDALCKMQNLNLISNTIRGGIGHNRWATHGIKNDTNAHPHLSNNCKFSLVHNGIIENYQELKQNLIQNGYVFYSQTDTEVIVNLLDFNYNSLQNVPNAISKTIDSLEGTYGLVIQTVYEPDSLFCVRNGSPLLIGQNEDMVIVTSEQSGFCDMIRSYITLRNDDVCIINRHNGSVCVNTNHTYINKRVNFLETDISPHPYKHWTLKEIHAQPQIVLNAINKGGRIKNDYNVKLGGLEQHSGSLKKISNIIILGCGTSFFAGLYGMYFFKKLCKFNTVQVFDGADFNDTDIPLIGETAFILISQSGETKDLYRCVEMAKSRNIITIGVINVVDSLIAKEMDCGVYCNAGKEVGVASTKAFTSQVVCLSMMSVWFASLHNINDMKRAQMIRDLRNLSTDIKATLDGCMKQIEDISKRCTANNMFLLGKGSDEYIAKEGALKIKEISYIHTEGYSASSLKHGPFALLDKHFPVIVLNLDSIHRNKIINCCQEVASRDAPILAITNDATFPSELAQDTVYIPENKTYASLLGIIPLQLLAYYLSVNKGINPDKPKNLAKVVTVE